MKVFKENWEISVGRQTALLKNVKCGIGVIIKASIVHLHDLWDGKADIGEREINIDIEIILLTLDVQSGFILGVVSGVG